VTRYFDQDAVAAIIEETKGPQPKRFEGYPKDPSELQLDLEKAAAVFRIQYALEQKPSNERVQDDLARIERLARQISNALAVPLDEPDTRTAVTRISEAKPSLFSALVREAHLYAVEHGAYPEFEPAPYKSETGEVVMDFRVDLAVRSALDNIRRLHRARAARTAGTAEQDPGPSPENWLIVRALPAIYEKHFDRCYSAAKSAPGLGPGVRFVSACLRCFTIEKSPEAIWQRYMRRRLRGHKGRK
jgi:hypothetical protein